MRDRRVGFTLIELLIVIGIIAVSAAVVIFFINPAALLKQARDATRIGDLDTINRAIAFTQASARTLPMGTSTLIYISLPDASSTCSHLGLPALSGGMSYACSSSASSSQSDGTGWLPINLASNSSVVTLPELPVDPTNSYESDLYYQYQMSQNVWKLTAKLESSKYVMQSANDGGTDPLRLEKGTDLSLVPAGGSAPGSPVMWLAADAITGKTNGATVSTWSDSSGHGYDALAVGGFPIYRTAVLNGKPILEFTAASDQKMRAYPSVDTPYTMFYVARMRAGTHGRVLGAIYPSGRNWLLGWWNGYEDTMYAEGFVRGGIDAASPTTWRIYTGKGTGALTSFYKNGTLLAENTDGLQGINSTLAIMGYDTSGTQELSDADVAEILIYPSALSNVDRAAVEAYLNSKYAIY